MIRACSVRTSEPVPVTVNVAVDPAPLPTKLPQNVLAPQASLLIEASTMAPPDTGSVPVPQFPTSSRLCAPPSWVRLPAPASETFPVPLPPTPIKIPFPRTREPAIEAKLPGAEVPTNRVLLRKSYVDPTAGTGTFTGSVKIEPLEVKNCDCACAGAAPR